MARSYNDGVADTEVLGGIVSTVAARARAMTPEFDPGWFLEGLSGQLQGLIPHDRLTILYLDEGGRTVSVFAEHTRGDAPRGNGRYTLSLAHASRYSIAEAVSSSVVAGQAEFVRDAQSEARSIGRVTRTPSPMMITLIDARRLTLPVPPLSLSASPCRSGVRRS